MKKIKIGIIGLGEVAQIMHIPALNRLQNHFEIIAISDISETLVEHIQKRYHIKHSFTNASELIRHDDVEAVMILSPDQLHSLQAAEAVALKKPVFLEKPACLLADEASKLDALASANQTPIMVAYMRCYTSAFEKAQQQLKNFGSISHVRAFDLQREGPYFFNQVEEPFIADDCDMNAIAEAKEIEAQNRKDLLGDNASDLLWKCHRVITGAAIHNLSALRNLIGSPKDVVCAYASKGGENITVVFDYGDFSCLYEIVIDNIARVDANIEIMSEYESIKLHYTTPYIRNLPTKLEVQKSDETTNQVTTFGPFYDDPFKTEILHFYDVVTGKAELKTDLAGAIKDLQLCEAITRKLKLQF